MLQQTQVPRVVPKYLEFLGAFPDVGGLAGASLADVLRVWQGLGYNRRAKYLWQAAQEIVARFDAVVPPRQKDLISLPGIGPNTAAAICVYAWNQPLLFVETNIRTVYIEHFFRGQQKVSDADILELLAATLDRGNPREFYWALMDYGTHLKKTVGNAGRASKAYAKQSRFAGSNRQIRGHVLRLLAERPHTLEELAAQIQDQRLHAILADLAKEGMVVQVSDDMFDLPGIV